jgi:hypothetical protein
MDAMYIIIETKRVLAPDSDTAELWTDLLTHEFQFKNDSSKVNYLFKENHIKTKNLFYFCIFNFINKTKED